MYSEGFAGIPHPCEVNDGRIIDTGMDALTVGIIAIGTPTITLELIVGAGCAENVLTDLMANLLSIDVMAGIDEGTLADETFNAVMTPSEPNLSSLP